MPISDGGLGAASRALGQVAGAAGSIGARLQQKEKVAESAEAARLASARNISKGKDLAAIDELIKAEEFNKAKEAYDQFQKDYSSASLNTWAQAGRDSGVSDEVAQPYNLRNNEELAELDIRFKSAWLAAKTHSERKASIEGAGTPVKQLIDSGDTSLTGVINTFSQLEDASSNSMGQDLFTTAREEQQVIHKLGLSAHVKTLMERAELALKLEPDPKVAQASALALKERIDSSEVLNPDQKNQFTSDLVRYMEERKSPLNKAKQLREATITVQDEAATGLPVSEETLSASLSRLRNMASDPSNTERDQDSIKSAIVLHEAYAEFNNPENRLALVRGETTELLTKDQRLNMTDPDVSAYNKHVQAFLKNYSDYATKGETDILPIITGAADPIVRQKFESNQRIIQGLLSGTIDPQVVAPLSGPLSLEPFVDYATMSKLSSDSVERIDKLFSTVFGNTPEGKRKAFRKLEEAQDSSDPERQAFGVIFEPLMYADEDTKRQLYSTAKYLNPDYKPENSSVAAESRKDSMMDMLDEFGGWRDTILRVSGQNDTYASGEALEAMLHANVRRIAYEASYQSPEGDMEDLNRSMSNLYTVLTLSDNKRTIVPTNAIPNDIRKDGWFSAAEDIGVSTLNSLAGLDRAYRWLNPIPDLMGLPGAEVYDFKGPTTSEYSENLNMVISSKFYDAYDFKNSPLNPLTIQQLSQTEDLTVWQKVKEEVGDMLFGERPLKELIELGEASGMPIFRPTFRASGSNGKPTLAMQVLEPMPDGSTRYNYIYSQEDSKNIIEFDYSDVSNSAAQRPLMNSIRRERKEENERDLILKGLIPSSDASGPPTL